MRKGVEITVTVSVDRETTVEVTGVMSEEDFKDGFKTLQVIDGIMNDAMQNIFSFVTGEGEKVEKKLLGIRFAC
ncbi:hypothetical protein NYE37_03800 [Thermoactinomyces sp. FSL K6-2592]|jgi:hypothetical protein|uniref:hypothetical protein n=1 Tax=Thermoactinomyces TaxID=2023 RepID=UPI0030F7CEA1